MGAFAKGWTGCWLARCRPAGPDMSDVVLPPGFGTSPAKSKRGLPGRAPSPTLITPTCSGSGGIGERLGMRAFARPLVRSRRLWNAGTAAWRSASGIRTCWSSNRAGRTSWSEGRRGPEHRTVFASAPTSPARARPQGHGRLAADRLRVEAATSCSKVIEEPPTDTLFLLLSARPDD